MEIGPDIIIRPGSRMGYGPCWDMRFLHIFAWFTDEHTRPHFLPEVAIPFDAYVAPCTWPLLPRSSFHSKEIFWEIFSGNELPCGTLVLFRIERLAVWQRSWSLILILIFAENLVGILILAEYLLSILIFADNLLGILISPRICGNDCGRQRVKSF